MHYTRTLKAETMVRPLFRRNSKLRFAEALLTYPLQGAAINTARAYEVGARKRDFAYQCPENLPWSHNARL
jgi:hypothetical protein